MAILGVLVLGAVLVFMEETHHYHVLRRVAQLHGHAEAASFIESTTTPVPRLGAPWAPLR